MFYLFLKLFIFFTEDLLTALDTVSGRKHPSTIQVKQLKGVLPLMPVIQILVSSPVSIYHYKSGGIVVGERVCIVLAKEHQVSQA